MEQSAIDRTGYMHHFSWVDHRVADSPQPGPVRHQISFHDKSSDRREFGQIQVIAAALMNQHSHSVSRMQSLVIGQ
jgi:hypothetical protein